MQTQLLSDQFNKRNSGRLQGYRELLDFYKGQQWPGREKWGEKRLTFNYARIFIDKLTSYLLAGRHFSVDSIEDTPQGRARAEEAERALEEVCENNHLEQLDYETETDCAILGDACYKVTWEEASPAQPTAAGRNTGRVRVTAPDIQGIDAWWAGDDISRVWKVASRYTLSGEEADLLYGARISQAFSRSSAAPPAKGQGSPGSLNTERNILEVWTAADFELYLDNVLLEKKANPYGFIPFVIFPNLREPRQFWGTSDLTNLMQPQQELNRAMSQISHILELSGNPVAVLENVTESTDIAVKPGAVWNIPEDAKAYLLDLLKDGGLKLHIDYIELLYRALHDICETPRAAFGGINRDLSGVALQIELYPLIQKVMRKRTIRNAVYNRRNALILKLLDSFQEHPHTAAYDSPQLRLRTVWGQVLPQDQARLIDNEKMLVSCGIHSRRRAMDDGVKDPEAEFAHWMEEEKDISELRKK